MASGSKKEGYETDKPQQQGADALRLGVISAAAALAGGLAVAWWYRKTLTKLQNPIQNADIPKSEFSSAMEDNTESEFL